ncbi:hypothetical protein Y032_0023g807 [Ancylostoma ceylanicum]|uniref:Uncharacterized protein n=1 Tax=Ancylostoma ceylanicum TaxID=53326 RepID=A0A016UX20_9BILA|nr:hypothetical protein Y032_0023g807 [Ancylostoma ceylanicum]
MMMAATISRNFSSPGHNSSDGDLIATRVSYLPAMQTSQKLPWSFHAHSFSEAIRDQISRGIAWRPNR